MTTAAIMTGRWFTIPTAVITASSEKTASRITICTQILIWNCKMRTAAYKVDVASDRHWRENVS